MSLIHKKSFEHRKRSF